MDLLNLAVPGAGTVVGLLLSIYNLCQEVKEGQDVCCRVHERLKAIFKLPLSFIDSMSSNR